MSTVWLIRNNCSIEGAVVDDKEKAKKEMVRLKAEHQVVKRDYSPERYNDVFYWRLEGVEQIK